MKHMLVILSAISLTACGVDGEPEKPQTVATVTLSNSGIHVGGGIGLSRGPVTLSLGL